MLDYLPMRLSLVPRLFTSARPVDAVLLHTSLPRQGKVSLGIEVNILPAAVEQARARGGVVIAQMNPHMPYTFGDGEIALDNIDVGLEVDEPLTSPAECDADDAAILIGERVARFASDGATLQLGIGQIPTEAARKMATRRGLRIWSEMISDGVLDLASGWRARARCARHHLVPDRIARAVPVGGRQPPAAHVADGDGERPGAHCCAPSMLSVNAAMQVDLFAQANASFIAGRIYSGFGGQPDFVTGALHSRGGHAVVALHAWHARTDSSTVVPVLSNPVTSFQHSAVVSEHGCADLFGHSQHTQAQALIDQVADPRARESLSEEALHLGLRRDFD